MGGNDRPTWEGKQRLWKFIRKYIEDSGVRIKELEAENAKLKDKLEQLRKEQEQ